MSNRTKAFLIKLLWVIAMGAIVACIVLLANILIETKRNSAAARANTMATREVVKELQDAVMHIDKDHEQKFNLLICMALVPQSDRTEDTVNHCRRKANMRVSIRQTTSGTTHSQTTVVKHSTAKTTKQPEQPTTGTEVRCSVNVLFIHLRCSDELTN